MTRVLARTLVVALFIFGVSLAGPVQAQDKDKAAEMKETADVVQTAQNTEGFETLVTALKAADLVEALKGEGPFTVFAPTNEAFEALPEGALDNLLKPANKSELQRILKYHVVKGTVMASDVTGLDEAKTLQGSTFGIETKDGTVVLTGDNQVTVNKTDITASNGVIHVIDAVLIPPAKAAMKDRKQ